MGRKGLPDSWGELVAALWKDPVRMEGAKVAAADSPSHAPFWCSGLYLTKHSYTQEAVLSCYIYLIFKILLLTLEEKK